MGTLAWTGIGCGGLAGLLIVLGAVTGCGASAAGSSSGRASQSAARVVTGGQVARDGDLAFRFKGITCGYAATLAVYSDLGVTGAQPVGTTECIIKLRITDDKREAQTFYDSSQYAYDARGRQLLADNNGVYLSGDRNAAQLNPGGSITALVPFNIPAGDSIIRLELHDSDFSGGVTVRL